MYVPKAEITYSFITSYTITSESVEHMCSQGNSVRNCSNAFLMETEPFLWMP